MLFSLEQRASDQWFIELGSDVLQICVILLSLLLVYDVFFVFITPFFTKVRPLLSWLAFGWLISAPLTALVWSFQMFSCHFLSRPCREVKRLPTDT